MLQVKLAFYFWKLLFILKNLLFIFEKPCKKIDSKLILTFSQEHKTAKKNKTTVYKRSLKIKQPDAATDQENLSE